MEYWEDYEVIEIETPELLKLHLPLAGFGPRALAFIVDSLIIAVVQLVLGGLLLMVGIGTLGSAGASGNTGLVIAFVLIAILLLILLYPAYHIIFESIWNGQTPGKRMTGIRVVRRGGLPLTPQSIWMRNLMRLVDMLPSNQFTGLVSFFVSASQQRVGDLVADTVVVREFQQQQPVSWVRSYGGNPALDTPEIGTVTPRIALAINSYLMRAVNFEPELRHNLSGRLVRALGYNADTLSLGQRDSYLASVLAQYHSRG
ncbi:MAG: RDD family protein [Planctomycetales bacterium]|nr:RDD family protein [bacterium]UNM08448.1 MAG: RDD family protein [Planctomycetales bacterium]